MSKEELTAKLKIEMSEVEKHRPELEAIEGRLLDNRELFLAWAKHLGGPFADDWGTSQDNFNRWVTGKEVHHAPTFQEAWEHYEQKVPEGPRHHHL